VEYRRGKPALRDFSFEARRGEITGITGENGAGKTTLARTLCGLRRERAGRIELHGKPVPYSRRPGLFYLVMQESGYQLFTPTVEQELALSKNKKSRPPPEKIAAILESLSLSEYKDRHPRSLSGGQKQRAAIGAALTQDAEVFIFDEPTSGLDFRSMRRVAAALEGLRRQNKIILVITHDHELLGELRARVVNLERSGGSGGTSP
jgi:energy-coupling factor transport system ATP-binding protein